MSEVKEFDIKWTMVVDLDKCTGCGACMVACQAENNVAPNLDGTNKVRSINWMKVYRLSNHKPFPEHERPTCPAPVCSAGSPPACPSAPSSPPTRTRTAASSARSAPLHRLPVLHGLMPLPCPLFQLV